MSLTVVLRLLAISALCFAFTAMAQNSETASHKPLPTDYEFTVRADDVWSDTGLDLYPGDRVHVYGAVKACENFSSNDKAHLPLPSAPPGALLVKLQPEAAPILAAPDADLPIVDPSHLFLGVNGWRCHGTVPAKVHVEWHKAAASTGGSF